MSFDRRRLFEGSGAGFVTCRAGFTSSFAVAVAPPFFVPDDEGDADAEWIELWVYTSRWHFDAFSFPKHAFIRHQETGLAYDIDLLEGDRLGLIQLDVRCCFGDERNDPDCIVGYAACRVINSLWPDLFPSNGEPSYVTYPNGSKGGAYICDAPPMSITPVSKWPRE